MSDMHTSQCRKTKDQRMHNKPLDSVGETKHNCLEFSKVSPELKGSSDT